VIRTRSLLRESYASLWKPWKLAKTFDKKSGRRFKKLKRRPGWAQDRYAFPARKVALEGQIFRMPLGSAEAQSTTAFGHFESDVIRGNYSRVTQTDTFGDRLVRPDPDPGAHG
jgi:hypothetical protein